jgi:hypothetical protein
MAPDKSLFCTELLIREHIAEMLTLFSWLQLDHLFQRRLNASYQHSVAYVKQFPSPIVSMVAKFVSFVTGACAAVLLGVALLDESLLEAQVS